MVNHECLENNEIMDKTALTNYREKTFIQNSLSPALSPLGLSEPLERMSPLWRVSAALSMVGRRIPSISVRLAGRFPAGRRRHEQCSFRCAARRCGAAPIALCGRYFRLLADAGDAGALRLRSRADRDGLCAARSPPHP